MLFYCTGGKFEEVVGEFLTEKHSPNADVDSTRRCTCASGEETVSSACELSTSDAHHRTQANYCSRVR